MGPQHAAVEARDARVAELVRENESLKEKIVGLEKDVAHEAELIRNNIARRKATEQKEMQAEARGASQMGRPQGTREEGFFSDGPAAGGL